MIEVRRIQTPDDEVWINVADLLAWLDESILESAISADSTAVKMEIAAKLAGTYQS